MVRNPCRINEWNQIYVCTFLRSIKPANIAQQFMVNDTETQEAFA